MQPCFYKFRQCCAATCQPVLRSTWRDAAKIKANGRKTFTQLSASKYKSSFEQNRGNNVSDYCCVLCLHVLLSVCVKNSSCLKLYNWKNSWSFLHSQHKGLPMQENDCPHSSTSQTEEPPPHCPCTLNTWPFSPTSAPSLPSDNNCSFFKCGKNECLTVRRLWCVCCCVGNSSCCFCYAMLFPNVFEYIMRITGWELGSRERLGEWYATERGVSPCVHFASGSHCSVLASAVVTVAVFAIYNQRWDKQVTFWRRSWCAQQPALGHCHEWLWKV